MRSTCSTITTTNVSLTLLLLLPTDGFGVMHEIGGVYFRAC